MQLSLFDDNTVPKKRCGTKEDSIDRRNREAYIRHLAAYEEQMRELKDRELND